MSVIEQRIVFFNVILHVRWHHLPIINIEIEDLTWHVHDFIHIVSVTVEKICDCFLILFVGSEAISEAGRHLARARLCLGKVATLSEDLLLVNVVCVCHVDIIGTGSDALGVRLCHLANWLGRLTSLYHLAGKFLQTASHKVSMSSSLNSS